jgi:hypothetical protein
MSYLSINLCVMKNLIASFLILFVFTGVSAQQAKLSGLLVEFETAVKWEAVDGQWKSRRADWINEVRAAKTPLVLGKLLAEFETYVTWAAVDKRWEGPRDRWISSCTAATSYSAVAKLLVEFESYTKWEGVTEVWKKRRDGWLKEAAAI